MQKLQVHQTYKTPNYGLQPHNLKSDSTMNYSLNVNTVRSTDQSQCINTQQLSQHLNALNKYDIKGTYNVSTFAFNMIIT